MLFNGSRTRDRSVTFSDNLAAAPGRASEGRRARPGEKKSMLFP